MIIPPEDHDYEIDFGICLKIISTILCALIFSTKYEFKEQLIMSLLVSFYVLITLKITSHMGYQAKNILSSLWFYELSSRNAYEEYFAQCKSDGDANIDWISASVRAAEDIKSANNDAKLKSELGGKLVIRLISYIIIIFEFLSWPALGYLINRVVAI